MRAFFNTLFSILTGGITKTAKYSGEIGDNVGIGLVGFSSAFRETGLWTEDMAKELRIKEEV